MLLLQLNQKFLKLERELERWPLKGLARFWNLTDLKSVQTLQELLNFLSIGLKH